MRIEGLHDLAVMGTRPMFAAELAILSVAAFDDIAFSTAKVANTRKVAAKIGWGIVNIVARHKIIAPRITIDTSYWRGCGH